MANTLEQQLIDKGLPHPFPASPTRPPQYGFYVYRDNKFHSYTNFSALYAASRYLNAIVQNSEIKWASDNEIEVFSDPPITIRGEGDYDLEKIVEHKDNKLEAQWELPTPYVQNALRTRMQPVPLFREEVEQTIPKPKPTRKPARRKQPEGDMITIAQIADELGISPRDARKVLRSSKTPKPEGGWQWSADEAEKIRKLFSPK